MNERIRELADQAELTIHTSIGTYMSHPEFNQKFAELIVRECILVMKEQERLPVGILQAKLSDTHEYAIKQHFGLDTTYEIQS